MSELAQLGWRNPWWLLLALQPLLLMLLALRGHWRVLHYADTHLRPWAVRGGLAAAQWSWSGTLSMLAWLLLACAAAGPRLPLLSTAPDGGAARVHDMDIIVVLDVSPSMQATDVSPQRLQRAKLELVDLLQRLRGERVGLIAFSGSAGVVTPPTDDAAVFKHYLTFADVSLFKTPGSNLAAALQLAAGAAPVGTKRTRAVLLATDGEADAFSGALGTAAQRAVQALKEQGVTVSVLVTATSEGARLPGAASIISRPDVNALRALAAHGGGQMEFVRDGDAEWRALYDNGLLALPGAAPPPERVDAWRELYAYVLAPALLLFALAHWPARATPVLAAAATGLVVASLLPAPAAATEAEAYAAYRAGDFTLAQLLYRQQRGYVARLGEGAAAYRRARYAEAAEQFSAALLNAANAEQRADALFNLGNAWYRSGKYAAAADAYGGAVELRPDHAAARANLARALARLRTLSVGDRTLEGVPRRRGLALGETPLGAIDGGVPRDFDTKREASGARHRGDAIPDGERATTAAPPDVARAAQLDTERNYRAALKKLELVNDRPADMLKELIKLDTPRDAAPELPPW